MFARKGLTGRASKEWSARTFEEWFESFFSKLSKKVARNPAVDMTMRQLVAQDGVQDALIVLGNKGVHPERCCLR